MRDEIQHLAVCAALNRAAAYGLAGVTSRSLRSPADGMRFVQAQIAETTLARRLVFFTGASPRFECDVAGGRLLRFAEELSGGTAGASGSFDDLSETSAIDDLLRVFSDLMMRSFEGETSVSLQTSPPSDASRSGGVSAHQVAERLGICSTRMSPPQFFKSYVDEAAGLIVSAAYLEGDLLYPLFGESETVDLLAEKLEKFLPDIERFAVELKGDDSYFLSIGNHLRTEPGLLFVARDEAILIAMVGPKSKSALAQTWYTLHQAG